MCRERPHNLRDRQKLRERAEWRFRIFAGIYGIPDNPDARSLDHR